jgi:putative ABC transport system permease protein
VISIARKNLFYNRTRLAVALGGVVFGVVLTLIQIGILLGFLNNATVVIDKSPADLWIMAPGTQNQDMAHPIPERTVERARATPGVEWAVNSIVAWGVWRGKDGKEENVEIVGVDLDGPVGIPYKVDPAVAARLREYGTVLLDDAEKKRLNVEHAGEVIELWGRRAEVVGFTQGGRSFTTAPMLVAAYDQAKEYLFTPMADKTIFVQVKAKPGVKVSVVQENLRQRLDGVEVLTAAEFRFRSKWYWLVTTGVGTGFLISALMGFLIGGAIVAQVLYANVVEHLKEYAVLKALGASPKRLVGILLEQALYVGFGGCGLAAIIAAVLGRVVEATQTPIWIPWYLIACSFFVTLAVCLTAAWVPAAKLRKLEPAMVFMG